jgi:hypothetical protein
MQVAELLRRIPESDLAELQLFLEAGFHNRGPFRKDVQDLFKILVESFPEIPDSVLEKNGLYQRLYPGKAPVAGKLEKTVSELYKLVREYLLWKYHQSEAQQFEKSISWAAILHLMGLDDKSEVQLKKTEKEFVVEKKYAEKEYFYKFEIEYLRYSFANKSNTGRGDINLQEALESLVDFYEICRLEMANKLLMQQKVTSLTLSPFVESIIQDQKCLSNDPDQALLRIHRLIQALLLQDKPNYEDFTSLMDELKAVEDQLNPNNLRDFYTYLRSFCTILCNTERNDLVPVLHQLQKDNLESGYLFIENKIPPTTYLNITRTAIASGQEDWAIHFVETYAQRIIHDNEQQDYYRTNKALCLFYSGRPEDALDYLPSTSSNIYYHLLARRIEIMCYFETDSDLAVYKTEAFMMYLRRASDKLLSPELLEANMAFASLIHQIIFLPKGDASRYKRVLKKIEGKSQIAESKWLLEKLMALR